MRIRMRGQGGQDQDTSPLHSTASTLAHQHVQINPHANRGTHASTTWKALLLVCFADNVHQFHNLSFRPSSCLFGFLHPGLRLVTSQIVAPASTPANISSTFQLHQLSDPLWGPISAMSNVSLSQVTAANHFLVTYARRSLRTPSLNTTVLG